MGCVIVPSAPLICPLSATPTLIIRDFCVIVVPWVPRCVFCWTESGEFSVSMKSMPSSGTCFSVRSASGSGGLQMPLPVMRKAPKPRR